ncbi:c-type cytochrome [Phreatobacter oligotrophus]|jgi:cytochrome c|uniref:Cytochrome c n=1 Tax=Phreatobacter oligotrophus TaxID=1122261 RepID=A0A2T4Z2J9_9HYPH|nr:cytochrome c family protein [Phreatobacter oligotrophus]PTM55009.1 cytochrome c [Phreatobacter oligotrophus]
MAFRRRMIALAGLALAAAASPAFAQSAPAPAAAPAAGAADPAAGERIFAQCRACHQIGPTARNGVGPQLNGIFGRKAGSVAGFNYSPAYQALNKVWDEDNFRVYIRNPREVTPGTRMVFNGLRDEGQITNLIAFLKQYNAEGVRSQ